MGPIFMKYIWKFSLKLQKCCSFQVLQYIKRKAFDPNQKSPKKEPNHLGSLGLKKSAQSFKKAPKWREIAGSGHTGTKTTQKWRSDDGVFGDVFGHSCLILQKRRRKIRKISNFTRRNSPYLGWAGVFGRVLRCVFCLV